MQLLLNITIALTCGWVVFDLTMRAGARIVLGLEAQQERRRE